MSKTILVVGAGVIGLAIAREISEAGHEVILCEKEKVIGSHTSSRNSGVIHAGIYYLQNSLKAELCIQGKELLYKYCKENYIPHKQVGKLIVATNKKQLNDLVRIRDRAFANGVDLQLLSRRETQEMEVELDVCGSLWSDTTGIVDPNELMFSLLKDVESTGGVLSIDTDVQKIEVLNNSVLASGRSCGEEFTMEVDFIINTAGHGANELAKFYWDGRPIPPKRYAKGNYFKITAGNCSFKHLVYPVPEEGGLGIHLTMNMQGEYFLGPDVQWVDAPILSVDPSLKTRFINSVSSYWPGVLECELTPDYAGIRPKINSNDFVIKRLAKVITLLGIESPGLTASLAIAKRVRRLLSE